MRQSWGVLSGPERAWTWGSNPAYLDIPGFRTVLRQCIWEVVLPAVTLLFMSLLTVATIVLVVTTIAKAGMHF
jgi:hypothetical protein